MSSGETERGAGESLQQKLQSIADFAFAQRLDPASIRTDWSQWRARQDLSSLPSEIVSGVDDGIQEVIHRLEAGDDRKARGAFIQTSKLLLPYAPKSPPAKSPLLLGEVLWRRRDQPGHDYCRIVDARHGFVIQGCAVTAINGRPYQAQYAVHCDRRWDTIEAFVKTANGLESGDVRLKRDRRGEWKLNRELAKDLQELHDVDLAITPATNIIPIRRLSLEIGASADVEAAWLQFPDLSVTRLMQRYTRVGQRTYSYESEGFTADLEVDDQGIVLRYGDLWERVAP